MKTAWIAALVVASVFLSSGCGTICNLASGDPDVYGGVQKDVTFIQTPNSLGGGTGDARFLALVVGAEMGLSLVADTLTLPVVVRMRRNENASDDKAEPTGDERGTSVGPKRERVFLKRLRRLHRPDVDESLLDGESVGGPRKLGTPYTKAATSPETSTAPDLLRH